MFTPHILRLMPRVANGLESGENHVYLDPNLLFKGWTWTQIWIHLEPIRGDLDLFFISPMGSGSNFGSDGEGF